jgi:hypothetical protein
MNGETFDRLSRRLAAATTRRGILKVFVGGMAAAAAGAMLPRGVWSQAPRTEPAPRPTETPERTATSVATATARPEATATPRPAAAGAGAGVATAVGQGTPCDSYDSCGEGMACIGYGVNQGTCCPRAQACCPPDRLNCFNSGLCCATDQGCASGACCPSAQVCGPAGTEVCCQPGETCTNGVCCPSGRVCLNVCCPEGQSCLGGDCGVAAGCSTGESPCANGCCPAGTSCEHGYCCNQNGQSCCPVGEVVCLYVCCPAGSGCVNGDTCCPAAQACGSVCCPGSQVCVGGACCDTSKTCGSACCPADQQCGNGICCPTGQVGCNGTCCPLGQGCAAANYGDPSNPGYICCPAAQIGPPAFAGGPIACCPSDYPCPQGNGTCAGTHSEYLIAGSQVCPSDTVVFSTGGNCCDVCTAAQYVCQAAAAAACLVEIEFCDAYETCGYIANSCKVACAGQSQICA